MTAPAAGTPRLTLWQRIRRLRGRCITCGGQVLRVRPFKGTRFWLMPYCFDCVQQQRIRKIAATMLGAK